MGALWPPRMGCELGSALGLGFRPIYGLCGTLVVIRSGTSNIEMAIKTALYLAISMHERYSGVIIIIDS